MNQSQPKMFTRFWTCLLLLVTVFLSLNGCSISERIVNEDREGEIPKSFFKGLKNNVSTKTWISKNLGEPTYYEELENQVVVATYQYTRGHYKSANALFVFKYNTVERTTLYLHLVFKKEVLKEHWVDSLAHVQHHKLNRYTREKKSFMGKLFGGLFGNKKRSDQKENGQVVPDSPTQSLIKDHISQFHSLDRPPKSKLEKVAPSMEESSDGANDQNSLIESSKDHDDPNMKTMQKKVAI